MERRLPNPIDPTQHYLFYLHGKIIEDQGLPAVSSRHGEYQYRQILNRLGGFGFFVVSEARPKGTDAVAYARRIQDQIHSLLAAGVPPEQITVVGASKGAYIAAWVSHLVEVPGLSYVLLGSCHANMVANFQEHGRGLHGHVLTLRDIADTQLAGSCQVLFELSESHGLGRHQEIILQLGTGHGILYKPLDEWVLPTVEWARR